MLVYEYQGSPQEKKEVFFLGGVKFQEFFWIDFQQIAEGFDVLYEISRKFVWGSGLEIYEITRKVHQDRRRNQQINLSEK